MLARIKTDSLNALRHNKLFSAIYHEARLRLENTGNLSPILIYQMGKVGSSSILDSLRSARLDRAVFHVHFLNARNIDQSERTLLRTFGRRGSVNRWGIYESRFVRRHILERNPGDIKIISLVREPVARNVSSYFANIDMFVPDCTARYETGQIGIGDLTRHFLNDFHEHEHPLNWFDVEMKSVFGIDVYSPEHLLSCIGGVRLYRRDKVDLIVLRLEDIEAVAATALRTFLELDTLMLIKANQAHDKTYNRVYRDFRKMFELPGDYLARMYESKFAKFFYSDTELQGFRATWTRRDTR